MDRNIILPKKLNRPPPSLSARRAWIEIHFMPRIGTFRSVALRKESVDRNLTWHCIKEDVSVALRKESVDRNKIRITPVDCVSSRSPQGERG